MTSPRSAPVKITGADASVLRVALAPWTVDAIAELVGERAARALDREQVLPARVVTRAAGRDRIALLTRLLALGDEISVADAAVALGDQGGLEAAERSGLVEVAGRGPDDPVRAAVDIRPYATDVAEEPTTWWIASDLGEAVTDRELREDHVLGVGGASLTLASATMRAPVGKVLDLGTGCGIQALHAASHVARITATDVSARALAFAEFNFSLNGPALAQGGGAAADVELREGSMLEPVAGELFDLVVTNPPFVITPPGAPSFEYRDTGADGDSVMRGLVSGIGAALEPGGVAHMLGNWEVRRGQEWSGRLETWLDVAAGAGHPVDAWVIQRDVLDAAEYAETWLRDAGVTPERDRSRYEGAYAAYLKDFDARGVEAVGFGLVILRRPASDRPAWRRFEELEGPMQQPIGPHLASSLAARDWLDSTTDEVLLGARLRVASDVTQETYSRPGSPDPEHILFRQGGGFGRTVRADTALAGFLGACDGELTVGQIAHALAAILDVAPGVMLDGIIPAARELLVDGMLERAE
jgi:SAM-dependent methyltransferase